MHLNWVHEIITLLLIAAGCVWWALRTWGREKPWDPTGRLAATTLAAKVLVGMLLPLLYLYYYQASDPRQHYKTIRGLGQLCLEEPEMAQRLLLTANPRLEPDYTQLSKRYIEQIPHLNDPASFAFAKLVLPVYTLAGGTYLGTSLLLSLLSFAGCWMLYRVLAQRYPTAQLSLAAIWLGYPSLLFWASGLMKESLLFAAFGFGLAALLSLLWRPITIRSGLIHGMVILVTGAVIFLVKPYWLFALIGIGAFAPLQYALLKTIRKKSLQGWLIPIVLGMLILGGLAWLLTYHPWYFEKALVTRLYSLNTSSAYTGLMRDIGNVDLSLWGVLSKVPSSLALMLAYPMPWEVRDVLSGFSALENTLILTWLVIFAIQLRKRKRFGMFGQDAFVTFCVAFGVCYLVFIGFSMVHAGSIARYKIYSLPILLTGLAIWSRRIFTERKADG
jgi:hypothetical protein